MADKTLDVTVYKPQAVMPVMDIRAAIVRQQAITDFVSSIMHKDTDYGAIPGTDKPTLLKPGAEKLTTFFGLSKRFTLVERVEDWTGTDHGGEPFFYYLYRCQLYSGDVLIAEADGSASSWESKYRYRNAERTCPNCGKPNIRKSNKDEGYYCWAKTGGCGGKFALNDKRITDQIVGKVPNPDPADIVNTILKMSQKRALIAATLLAVNASEFFTQDMEDFVEADYTVHTEQKPEAKPAPSKSAPKAAPDVTDAEFETLPSASQERGNGKQAPAAPKHDPNRPWDDDRKAEAVRWAMRTYPSVYNAPKHAMNSLDNLLEECASKGMAASEIAAAWKDKVHGKYLDAQAAAEEAPADKPQF